MIGAQLKKHVSSRFLTKQFSQEALSEAKKAGEDEQQLKALE